MIKLLDRLMYSREPIRPSEEERLTFEALFDAGLVVYVANIKLGDGYLISAKGREMVSPHRQRDTI